MCCTKEHPRGPKRIHPDDFDQVQVLLGGHADGRYLGGIPQSFVRMARFGGFRTKVHRYTTNQAGLCALSALPVTSRTKRNFKQRLGERIKELSCLYQGA